MELRIEKMEAVIAPGALGALQNFIRGFLDGLANGIAGLF